MQIFTEDLTLTSPFAQSASANTGRMLPATEREEHGTIKGKNVALFRRMVWVPPAAPCSTERQKSKGKGVAIVAVLAEGGGRAGGGGPFRHPVVYRHRRVYPTIPLVGQIFLLRHLKQKSSHIEMDFHPTFFWDTG
jgi:hypothetical protein